MNGTQQYRDKFIYLAGKKFSIVPPNECSHSSWEEHVVDIPTELWSHIGEVTEFEVDNPVGDYFKFSGLTLAVKLADGTWVQSIDNETVYSSMSDWYYTEGNIFKDSRSGVVRVHFELEPEAK